MKKRSLVKGLCLGLSAILLMGMGSPMTAEAAKKKPAVKTVSLLVGGKQVNSKTVTVKKGSTVKVSVKVNPSNAKKSTKIKTSNKKIATVSGSKVKTKKYGTSKITVTVKGKNGKSKSAWFKVKVVKSLPKPAAKPAPQPSKPVVQPSKPSTPSQPSQPTQPSKPEEPKPVDPTPENPKEDPKPVDPTPEDPDEPDVNWKTCQHDWGAGAKYQQRRSVCTNCGNDYEDIYHHEDVELEKDSTSNCGAFGIHLVRFYECEKCGAGMKRIPDWYAPSDQSKDKVFIYETYEECLAYTPY